MHAVVHVVMVATLVDAEVFVDARGVVGAAQKEVGVPLVPFLVEYSLAILVVRYVAYSTEDVVEGCS